MEKSEVVGESLWCSACSQSKPASAFHKATRKPSGHQSQCRDCVNAWQRRHYQDNPERRAKVIARAREVARDPVKNKQRYDRRRANPDQWERILERGRRNSRKPGRADWRRRYEAAYYAEPSKREHRNERLRAWRADPEVHGRRLAQERTRREVQWEKLNDRQRKAYRSNPDAQRRNIERRRAEHFAAFDGVFRVYFVESPRMGAIKIGRTRGKAAARMTGMQTGNPDVLVLLGVIRGATHREETAIHRRFKHLRIRGEWFTRTPDLMNYINEHATADE